jgi:phosphoribosylformylglycinamidine synthase subunit PurL
VLESASELPAHAFWFGEDQARYVVTAKDAAAATQRAKTAGVPLSRLGATGGNMLMLPGGRPLPVGDLKESFEAWLPAYMAGAA